MSVETRKTRLGQMVSIRYRDAQGQHHRETLGLKSEGWTTQKARSAERERIIVSRLGLDPSGRGNGSSPTSTFEALARQWYDETGRLKAWKPRTKKAYARAIVRLQHFHEMNVAQIRAKHVAEFIAQHRVSPAGRHYAGKTTNFDVSVLYAIFEYGMTHELLKTNPAARAPRPKNGKKKWRILTPEEIQRVDRAFDDVEFESEEDRQKARLMFRVLTRTAIRRHELRQLRVRDFDPERRVLRIVDSKTEEGERSIALPESLSTQLEKSVGDKWPHDLIFQSSRSNPVGAQWYTEKFHAALKEAGITDYVRPFHDMRHTALTNEAATGKSNPVAIMAKAGHKSFATTRQYLQLAGVVFHDEAEALERRLNGH